jgi:hypothetical protein
MKYLMQIFDNFIQVWNELGAKIYKYNHSEFLLITWWIVDLTVDIIGHTWIKGKYLYMRT